MDWTEETIAQLRHLWSEGHSTAEIGRRLGVTKNAVVGKAHRLLLPPRPSPIRRGTEAVLPQVRRVHGPTLAGLDVAGPAPAATAVPPPPPPVPSRPALRPVTPSPRQGRVSTCCWPIGEPGTRSFHFCDDPAMTARPYCETHALLAYVKVRDRREDAA